MTRLNQIYTKSIRPELLQQNGYKNILEVPKLQKIVVNMGLGEAVQDSKKVASAVADLTKITGQKPIITKASKSVAGFKLREGMPIGCKVTLRKERMYEFLERLIDIAIPRQRDFRGVNPRSFDGRGNFAMGLEEQIVFPEIDYDKIDKIRGLNITIVTSARNDTESRALLKAFNFPLKEMS